MRLLVCVLSVKTRVKLCKGSTLHRFMQFMEPDKGIEIGRAMLNTQEFTQIRKWPGIGADPAKHSKLLMVVNNAYMTIITLNRPLLRFEFPNKFIAEGIVGPDNLTAQITLQVRENEIEVTLQGYMPTAVKIKQLQNMIDEI